MNEQSPKRLDGVVGPVFKRASDVDWQEVRGEWEKRTGKKLHYSIWRGLGLWFLLVGIFIYLQVAFFNLYFSRGFLEQKTNNVINLAKTVKLGDNAGSSIQNLQNNLSELRFTLAQKGQFFIFLSYNPLFKAQTIDLSRLLLINQSVLNLKTEANNVLKTQNQISFKINLWLVSFDLKSIEQLVAGIKTEQFESYKQLATPILKNINTQVNYLRHNSGALAYLLGVGSQKKYLLLFPNNKEARNWGGFPGTYGELTIENGKAPSFFTRDIYYLSHLIRGDNVKSIAKPSGFSNLPSNLQADLNIFNNSSYFIWWFLHDSAVSLDFSTNAERAIWYYQNIYNQGSVDGAIAITPDIVIDILKIIGPIEMPDYATIVNADNFRDVIEYKVEVDNAFKKGDRTKDPKQILADLAPKFLQKIQETSMSQKIAIAQALLTNFQEKQILVYSNNDQSEKLIDHYNAGGIIKSSPYDYLAIFDNNYNGRKTSLALNYQVKLSSAIDADNLVNNQLNINIHNISTGKELFGGKMNDILEIAVPKGAVLKSVSKNNQDIVKILKTTQEKDKTIFFIPYISNPGETINFLLTYNLTMEDKNNWGLILQKQPGMEELNFNYQINSKNQIDAPEGLINQEQLIKTDQEFQLKIK